MLVLIVRGGGLKNNQYKSCCVNVNFSVYETLSTRVCVSKNNHFSLNDYCIAREQYCSTNHHNCVECARMVNIAQAVISEGMYSLKSLFQKNFPGVSYKAANAKRRILQMPLVTLL